MSGAPAKDRHSSRSPNTVLGIHIAQLEVAHNREITHLKDDFHNRVITQLIAAYERKMASLKRAALKRPSESSDDAQPKRSRVDSDEITLVCTIKGMHESVIAITISANALVRDLAEKICNENASQLGNIAAKQLDVRCTAQLAKKWTSFDKDSCVVMPMTVMGPKRQITYYFPSYRDCDSGTVQIVAEVAPVFSRTTFPDH
ncbi:hypothetical protein GN958_ATG10989 [Phytophthora infestans]|uniref:Crinkler effector protein N-terminal domain-containing protein n=1 Tax=Phytophthora infestans TaxID=4787 RepID=A0A8S9UN00_PHYIN|nr:hypothetical protein GN958_ATG10989 [Phytophthora infestans]